MSDGNHLFFTEKEAAHYLNVSTKTLSRWRCYKCYALPFLKIGGKIRYRQSDLTDFLNKSIQSGL